MKINNTSFFFSELAAEFISRPQNQEVVEGEKAEFACSVSKETYEVKWFRGNTEVEAGDKYTIISEGKRRAIIVKNCELKDEGAYIAHIGSVKASADLFVIGKTHISRRSLVIPEQSIGFNWLTFCYRKTEDHYTN